MTTPHVGRPTGLLRRLVVLVIGILSLLLGVAMTIAADVGAGSWQVFEVALADRTGLGLGTVIIIESVVAIAIAWWWLGQPLGPATIVLGLSGGPFIQWSLTWLPQVDTVPAGVAMLLVGSVLTALGVGLYVPAELGPSAQDSLFVGLYRRFDIRPGIVKFLLDAALALAGWALGGPIGLGTVLVTVLIPPMVDVALPWGHVLANTPDPRRHVTATAAI